jgi:hypothetical protein
LTGLRGSKAEERSDSTTALDEIALDRRIRAALDAHRRGAAAAAEKDVDDRVDEGAVDRAETVVVPFVGTEDAEHRRQRDRVEVVTEANRGDVVDRNLDIVGGEIPQARRHQAHETVEDDLEHRQALVGDERRVDDCTNPRAVPAGAVAVAEAEEAVDLILIEDARRIAGARRLAGRGAVAGQRGPFFG